MCDVLLEVQDLKKFFKTSKGMLHAVDGVSFTIERGKTLGIVGESGCGKTTTGRAILRLVEPTSGKIVFEGKDISKLRKREMRKQRQNMQLIFQDPFSSLDPRKTVSQLIREPIVVNKLIRDKRLIEARVKELMELVGMAERFYNSYPHELDGGRRQRIGIARALAINPKFIVCDEPVSALDVSIQAQILNLLKELQHKLKLTYIFITHDLSVVNYFADEIAVMYLGKLVEKAPTEEIFAHPIHPYTQALLSAIPNTDIDIKMERILIKGEVSSPVNLPDACRFAKRCNYTSEICEKKDPELREIFPQHFVACYCPHKHYCKNADGGIK
jgi:peptide/nickel transport system ATP-binding protein